MLGSPHSSNFLYHQYLKGDACSVDAVSPLSQNTTFQSSGETVYQPAFHWDLKSTCKPLYPAFHYISQQLARQGLQIALIVSDQHPFALPIWQLPRRSQILLTKIVRKACARYSVNPSWMTALASLENRTDLSRIFDAHKPDAYIIRRSILQNEIIFSAEGLILLSIDHIYTLKQLLCTLSKEQWVSHSRSVCLSSCSHLLHRIHTIHNSTKFTKGYIERVYREIPFHEAAFDEVNAEYDATFCTASIRDITASLQNFHLPHDSTPEPDRAELPTPSTNEPFSPLADLDLSTVSSWGPELEPTSAQSAHVVKSFPVTYPLIHQPSSPPLPAQQAEIWHRSLATSPASTTESWGPDAPPSPLRIVKREDTGLSNRLGGEEEDECDRQHVYSVKSLEEEIESQIEREVGNEEKEEEHVERDEDEELAELLRPVSHIDVQAWSRDVQEVICSRCCSVIEAPRRHTLCY